MSISSRFFFAILCEPLIFFFSFSFPQNGIKKERKRANKQTNNNLCRIVRAQQSKRTHFTTAPIKYFRFALTFVNVSYIHLAY